jgi:GAF domain-containing protein
LSDFALALNNADSAKRAAAIIVDECVCRFGATVADLWLADSPRQELRLAAHRAAPRLSDAAPEAPRPMPLGAATVAATAARSGEPVEVGDVGDVGLTLATSRQTLEREGLRSIYAQPLVTRERLVGVLAVIFDVPRVFTADDRALLQAMGDLAAAAIERTCVEEEGQKAS